MEKEQKKLSGKRLSGADVYARIRDMAIDYELVPGQTIKEATVAEQLEVSRTPVREALNRLVTEGLITFQKNRGFFCRSITADELFDQAEVRLGLELMAIDLVIDRASDKKIKDIADYWTRAESREAKSSSLTMAHHDERFHEMIVEAAANPILLEIVRNINARIRFVRRLEVEKAVRSGADFKHHNNIMRALSQRDKKAARQALETHLTFTRADSIEVLKLGLEKILNTKLSQ